MTKPDFKSRDSGFPAIANEIFHVKGWRRDGFKEVYVETRIRAATADEAIGIAHEREIRVAECRKYDDQ